MNEQEFQWPESFKYAIECIIIIVNQLLKDYRETIGLPIDAPPAPPSVSLTGGTPPPTPPKPPPRPRPRPGFRDPWYAKIEKLVTAYENIVFQQEYGLVSKR